MAVMSGIAGVVFPRIQLCCYKMFRFEALFFAQCFFYPEAPVKLCRPVLLPSSAHCIYASVLNVGAVNKLTELECICYGNFIQP